MTSNSQVPSVAILGGGRLGTAVASLLAPSPAKVMLWARRKAVRTKLQKVLDGCAVVPTLEDACGEADLIIIAVPASGVREIMRGYGEVARGDQIVLHGVRGVEEGFVLLHRIVREETCVRKIGALGGPLMAPELHAGLPVTAVVASRFEEPVASVRAIAEASPIFLHATRDLVGVEVIGAISNVTAIAVGMAHGLQLGETARGVLLTHGLADAARIGTRLGAERTTFAGLAGIGDMIPRKVNSTDQHHAVGRKIAGGAFPDQDDVEGLVTARAAVVRAMSLGIRVPLVEAVAAICARDLDPREGLMGVLESNLDLDGAFGGR